MTTRMIDVVSTNWWTTEAGSKQKSSEWYEIPIPVDFFTVKSYLQNQIQHKKLG